MRLLRTPKLCGLMAGTLLLGVSYAQVAGDSLEPGTESAEPTATPVVAPPPPSDSGSRSEASNETVEEAKPALTYQAPFSLTDCLSLLSLAGEQFPSKQAEPRTSSESMLRLLDSVASYLKLRDDMHSSLIGYDWTPLGEVTVSEALIEDSTFVWEPAKMPRNVSALSFEVDGADVKLYALKVYDSSQAEGEEPVVGFSSLEDDPAVLRRSLPRREVFHLWRPTDIKRVEVAYALADPASQVKPRLSMHAGRTDQPEHGKSAIYYITRAQQRLRSERFPEAYQDILRAEAEVRLYRSSRLNRR